MRLIIYGFLLHGLRLSIDNPGIMSCIFCEEGLPLIKINLAPFQVLDFYDSPACQEIICQYPFLTPPPSSVKEWPDQK